jgi:nuclear pore complex protein Nup98-Nup96
VRPSWGPRGTLSWGQHTASLRVLGGAQNSPNPKDGYSASLLKNHRHLVHTAIVNGVPKAVLSPTTLKDLFHGKDMKATEHVHEKLVWDLADILFDPVKVGIDESTRRSELSKFWSDLVQESVDKSVALAGSHEEKALACLSGHRIQEACKHLLAGKNFRLATLVSLIGTSERSKRDMRSQLKEWRSANILAEFSEPIRAMYELLGGNVCVSEGKKNVPVEDRMDSFVISKQFGFDWRQAFGLRLWYGISPEDSISGAVKLFQGDIEQDKEGQPSRRISAQFAQGHEDSSEDLLWGLLKLYTGLSDVETILRAEIAPASPFNLRLGWQLRQALYSTERFSAGQDATESSDAATLSYAEQLASEGDWGDEVFVLLHIIDNKAREKAIRESIARNVALYRHQHIDGKVIDPYETLGAFKVPESWLWEAEALYARYSGDPVSELKYALKARLFIEGHRTLVQQVAPTAVIEREYSALAHSLTAFEGHEGEIPEWAVGGGIYRAFTLLHERLRSKARVRKEDIDSILASLPAMNESLMYQNTLCRAAITEIAFEVGKVAVERREEDRVSDPFHRSGGRELKLMKPLQNRIVSKVLALPLTSDARLNLTSRCQALLTR